MLGYFAVQKLIYLPHIFCHSSMMRLGDHWPRKYKWPPLICVIKQSSTVAAPQWQETFHAATVSYAHTFQLKHLNLSTPICIPTGFPLTRLNYNITKYHSTVVIIKTAVKSLSVMVLKPKYNLLWIKSKQLKSRVNNIYQLKIHFQPLYVFNHFVFRVQNCACCFVF